MLAVSRKEGERVQITLGRGRVGWVKVIEVKGDRVRLGFEFPLEHRIMREEIVYDRDGKGDAA